MNIEPSVVRVSKACAMVESQTGEICEEIREAGQRAIATIEAEVDGMVAEVMDIQHERCKALDRQENELKTHLNMARSAVQFGRKAIRHGSTTDSGAFFSLLQAVETRATSLLSVTQEMVCDPVHNSLDILFRPTTSGQSSQAKEIIGKVSPTKASAQHSAVIGDLQRTVLVGEAVTFDVILKNSTSARLANGGDLVTARLCGESLPTTAALQAELSQAVTDRNDGSYAVSLTLNRQATVDVEVHVNGQRLPATLHIRATMPSTWAFDPGECHPAITIDSNGQRASIIGGGGFGYLSVLGSTAMTRGMFVWKIKAGQVTDYHMLGIASKPLASRVNDHSSVAFCVESDRGAHLHDNAKWLR